MPPEIGIHPERWVEALREASTGRFVLLAHLVMQVSAWVQAYENRKLRDTDLPADVWRFLLDLHNPKHRRRGRPIRNGWMAQLMRDSYDMWYPLIKAMRRWRPRSGIKRPEFTGIDAYGRGQTPAELTRQIVATDFHTSADNVKDVLRKRKPPSRIKHPKT